MTTTVLIVDDHPGYRSWTRSLLQMEGFVVVGEAADGSSAVVMARELQPDLVILDVLLPDISGLVVARQLAALDESPSVILISSREAADFGGILDDAPALAFIPKSELSGQRLRTVWGMAR